MGVDKPRATDGNGLEVNPKCQLPKQSNLNGGVRGIALEHDAVERLCCWRMQTLDEEMRWVDCAAA
jgi:hypothetical protein